MSCIECQLPFSCTVGRPCGSSASLSVLKALTVRVHGVEWNFLSLRRPTLAALPEQAKPFASPGCLCMPPCSTSLSSFACQRLQAIVLHGTREGLGAKQQRCGLREQTGTCGAAGSREALRLPWQSLRTRFARRHCRAWHVSGFQAIALPGTREGLGAKTHIHTYTHTHTIHRHAHTPRRHPPGARSGARGSRGM